MEAGKYSLVLLAICAIEFTGGRLKAFLWEVEMILALPRRFEEADFSPQRMGIRRHKSRMSHANANENE